MKKYIAILSLVIVFCMSFSIVALGAGNDYEMPTIPLSGRSTTRESGTVPGVGDEWETPGVPLEDITKTVSIKKCAISGIKSKTYTGKGITQSITVKYNGATLKSGTDYTVTYKNNKNVGTATAVITGIGAYEDSVNKTFIINPKGTALVKVTSPKSKKLKVTWKKQTAQTSGYQLQYSTSSKFTAKTTKSVKAKSKVTSKTISKLKGKSKYYVRIRTYKTVNGKTYYSSWSKVKSVKVKK